MTPEELRERITGLRPDEAPTMNKWLALFLALVTRTGYRQRRR